jgi:hypothetical protein
MTANPYPPHTINWHITEVSDLLESDVVRKKKLVEERYTAISTRNQDIIDGEIIKLTDEIRELKSSLEVWKEIKAMVEARIKELDDIEELDDTETDGYTYLRLKDELTRLLGEAEAAGEEPKHMTQKPIALGGEENARVSNSASSAGQPSQPQNEICANYDDDVGCKMLANQGWGEISICPFFTLEEAKLCKYFKPKPPQNKKAEAGR